MRIRSKTTGAIAVAAMAYVMASVLAVHAQQNSKPTVPMKSLRAIDVPEPPNLGDFVADKQAAIALGKAFFWDTQVGSDNQLACASCHFHAGADNRIKNQINPNLTNALGAPTSTTFDAVATGDKGGPNYTLRAGDFPFHQLQDPKDRDSIVLYSSNDVVSSAGANNSQYVAALPVGERQKVSPDGVFQVGTVQTRRVEPRNTPTVINAALNFRNFWDGRANFVFNGVTPFGTRDKDAKIWVDEFYTDKTGKSV